VFCISQNINLKYTI